LLSGTCLCLGLPKRSLILLWREILVLGCGKYIQPVDPQFRKFIRSTGMKLEVVDSRNAASTYNILNEEGRIVAAALIPYGVST
jgi:NADH dehydrogenase [ubiquinone] 1 alpha subcomplex assembly factor 3